MSIWESLGLFHVDRIVIAAILGAIIGWEREQHGRPAGLRTHMLVCMGAALMTIISENMYAKYQAPGLTADSFIRVDPGRIAAQIITGIGFIGAGVIMKIGPRVQGLTTAACLWLVAGVGMAVGTGLHILALVTTLISAVVLMHLGKLEKGMERDIYKTLTIHTKGAQSSLDSIRSILKGLDVTLTRYNFEEDIEKNTTVYILYCKMRQADRITLVSQAIREKLKDSMTRFRWD
jgi:putative Mg2+ transporter-C (MgtC) family protein